MNFDVLMPTILFAVTLASMFLGRKGEAKLKSTVEGREFKTRDSAIMVIMIAVAVSVVMFVPNMALMALFLFSYSSLLFTVSYAFSDMRTKRINVFIAVFIVASIFAGAVGFFTIPPALRVFGMLSFASFANVAFLILVHAKTNPTTEAKPRWYVAALSPALFLLLFAFFSGTSIWFPYLLDAYGIIFALLIVMYMNSLFTWKTVFIFAAFITALDIVLVWLTGTMVQAAEQISGLGLPVLVAFPTIPTISTTQGILIMRLGLGDFFFAGVLSSQTMKRFGTKTAVFALLLICVSFGLFELILLNKELAAALPVQALPATLPILLGWLPVVAVKMLVIKTQKNEEKPKSSIDN